MTWLYDNELLLRKRKAVKRYLQGRGGIAYTDKRMAVLGGLTTADIKDMLDLIVKKIG